MPHRDLGHVLDHDGALLAGQRMRRRRNSRQTVCRHASKIGMLWSKVGITGTISRNRDKGSNQREQQRGPRRSGSASRPAAPHLRSCAPDCRGNGFANCHREVIVDAALAESRQQALALKGILAEVGRQGDVKMSRKRASRILLLASPTVLLPVGIGVDNDR
jgi:hypothetical protein